jgi:DNA replication protein DnaC
VPVGHPDFGKPFRCACHKALDTERNRRRLLEMDGLSNSQRELRFERLTLTPENRTAFAAVENALHSRRGMVTLLGPPGTGKTTLLVCAVNAAREANVPSIYTTVTDLLDYLRSAFRPENPRALNFDARWMLLLSADVLALDELDEFSSTEWAQERFYRLIDERWLSMSEKLTMLATNSRIADLPPKIASRLSDGRASIVGPGSTDLRPFSRW